MIADNLRATSQAKYVKTEIFLTNKASRSYATVASERERRRAGGLVKPRPHGGPVNTAVRLLSIAHYWRRQMRRIMIAGLFLGIFIRSVNPASAQCDCIGSNRENDYRGSPYRTAYHEFEHSEIVFIGEVVDRKKVEIPGSDDYEYEVTYRVKRAWKKEIEELTKVRIGGPCLLDFGKGETVLVYAFADKSQLRLQFCSRTRLLSKAAADLEEFNKVGVKPQKVIKVP